MLYQISKNVYQSKVEAIGRHFIFIPMLEMRDA